MRILLLAHVYPPEMGGPQARLHGLARWLAAFGHQVTVITGFPNYPIGTVPEAYHGRLRAIERLDSIDLLRTWVYASSFRVIVVYDGGPGARAVTHRLRRDPGRGRRPRPGRGCLPCPRGAQRPGPQ